MTEQDLEKAIKLKEDLDFERRLLICTEAFCRIERDSS